MSFWNLFLYTEVKEGCCLLSHPVSQSVLVILLWSPSSSSPYNIEANGKDVVWHLAVHICFR